MKYSRIVLTGATGYIGSHLYERLCDENAHVSSITRPKPVANSAARERTGEDYASELRRGDVIVHLAGRAHLRGRKSHSYGIYHEDNVALTIALAKAAVAVGASKFIFVSSCSVYGIEESEAAIPMDSICVPQSNYGQSKLLCEIALENIFGAETIEYTIVRPPLVYGFNAPGIVNFIRLINKMPIIFFGSFIKNNARSMVNLNLLLANIIAMIDCNHALQKLYIIADRRPKSTYEFLGIIAEMHDQKPRHIILDHKVFNNIWIEKIMDKLNSRATKSLIFESNNLIYDE